MVLEDGLPRSAVMLAPFQADALLISGHGTKLAVTRACTSKHCRPRRTRRIRRPAPHPHPSVDDVRARARRELPGRLHLHALGQPDAQGARGVSDAAARGRRRRGGVRVGPGGDLRDPPVAQPRRPRHRARATRTTARPTCCSSTSGHWGLEATLVDMTDPAAVARRAAARDAAACGSKRPRTRACASPTSPPWPPSRAGRRRARGLRQHLGDADAAASARSSAPTSSCTRRRSTWAATATSSAARS